MSDIERIVGAPGTGKTRYLMTILEELKSQGVDAEQVGLFSFSKAANRESVSRAAALYDCEQEELSREGYFRTVHSAAYKLGDVSEGEILSDNKESIEWISNQLGSDVQTRLSETEGAQVYVGGDEGVALNLWGLCRSTLTPVEKMFNAKSTVGGAALSRVQKIIDQYETCKRVDGRLDFEDLLLRFAGVSMTARGDVTNERPLGDVPDLTHILFDEHQDSSALIQKCCDRFVNGLHTEKATFVGDPMQSIFGFAGSSSDYLMKMDVDSEHIMPRSYRCCREVMEFAENIIREMKTGYFDRKVKPADHNGSVYSHLSNEMAFADVNPEDDTLVIARTAYRVKEAAAVLADLGIPFKRVESPEGPTVSQTACTVLHDLRRGEAVDGIDFARAVQKMPINSPSGKLLERGVKAKWKRTDTPEKIDVVFREDLLDLGFTEHAVETITSGNWPRLIEGGSKWINSVRKHGVELTNYPKVRIGTIHKTKGQEANDVFFCTATSSVVSAAKYESDRQHDEELRIGYVAATRARHNLHVIEQPNQFSMLE